MSLTAIIERLPRRAIGAILGLIRDYLGVLVALAALAGLGWLLAGRGLTGRRLLLWNLVPFLIAAALVCWVGPDRLFPKDPYEGPILLGLSENHALTLLDLPGAVFAVTGAGLGLWLLRERWRVGG